LYAKIKHVKIKFKLFKLMQKLFNFSLSRNRLVALGSVFVFAALGVYLLSFSHASTPYASVEAELGTIGNSATTVSDSLASNGSYVKFNTASANSTSNVVFFNNENYTGAITDAAHYQVMVLQYNGYSGSPAYSPTFVAALHAANPKVKVLMYQDPIYSRPTDAAGFSVCGDWSQSGGSPSSYPGGNDTSWFLKNQSGNSILATDGGDYLMDEGNTGYQKSCLEHAISLAKPAGFNGIYWDDANPAIYYIPSGQSVPSYPTNTSWQSANESFLNYAEVQLHAQGLLSTANIGNVYGASDGHVWRQYSQYLDGSEEEAWMTSSTTTENTTSAWLTQEGDDLWSEESGKLAFEHSYAGNEAGNTYGLASLLLVASGESSYSTANSSSQGECYAGSGCEANYAEYTTAEQLGTPSSAATPAITSSSSGAGTTVYSRKFANGLVIVNPTGGSLSYTLPSGTYSGSGSEPKNLSGTISVPAASGYILLNN
jgi:hypothetical protein